MCACVSMQGLSDFLGLTEFEAAALSTAVLVALGSVGGNLLNFEDRLDVVLCDHEFAACATA